MREISIDIAGFTTILLRNFVGNASRDKRKPLKLLPLFVLAFPVFISWGHEIKGLDSVHICDPVTVAVCFISRVHHANVTKISDGYNFK